jgi:hypothetical protein
VKRLRYNGKKDAFESITSILRRYKPATRNP